jgi:hypothetical protein
MPNKSQTTPTVQEVTGEMLDAGIRAFAEVLERHDCNGLITLGFFRPALAEAYRAMEAARAKA